MIISTCAGNLTKYAGIKAWEDTFGKVDVVTAFGGGGVGWVGQIKSINEWLVGHFDAEGRPDIMPIVSMPMFPKDIGCTIEAAAAGKYDQYYRVMAKGLQKLPGAQIHVRLPWEFNTPSQPWYAHGKELLFAEALRQMVRSMRVVDGGERLLFHYCWLVRNWNYVDLEKCWPGNDYVDFVGADLYEKEFIVGHDTPAERWALYRDCKTGLNALLAFASGHGKPIPLLHELGFGYKGDNPYIVEQAFAWLREHGTRAFYWNSNSAYPGALSQYPKMTAAMKAGLAL